MCGIAGIISQKPLPQIESLTQKIIRSMIHRGPDNASAVGFKGNAAVKKLTVKHKPDNSDNSDAVLIHTRLSIIDLSHNADQPLCSADSRYWIVYNGEVYNYIELREQLKSKGFVFKTTSDTEVVLYSYIAWNRRCLDKFNGMFAFAIWDAHERKLFCARDRFGIKPLHFFLHGQTFLFASEQKTLFSTGIAERVPEIDHILDYLSFGKVLFGRKTFWKGIHQLEPGEYCSFKEGALDINRWYSFKIPDVYVKPDIEHIRELMDDSVRLRLRSDVPVASCLSGGIDSSFIVATMRKLGKPGRDIKTYTAMYTKKVINEPNPAPDWQLAKHFSRQLGTSHREINIEEKASLENLVRFVIQNDQPVKSSGAFNQFALMKEIHRDGVKVVLDGQGGDELFLGYFYYYGWVFKHCSAHKRFNAFAKMLLGFFKNRRTTLRKMVRNTIPELSIVPRYLVSRRILSGILQKDIQNRPFKSYLAYENLGDYNSGRYSELFEEQLPWLLRDEDHNSMSHSVETRLPFLDYRLVEYGLSLDPIEMLKNGWSKYPLRKASSDRIPQQIAWNRWKFPFYFEVADSIPDITGYTCSMLKKSDVLSHVLNIRKTTETLLSKTIPRSIRWRLFCLATLLSKM